MDKYPSPPASDFPPAEAPREDSPPQELGDRAPRISQGNPCSPLNSSRTTTGRHPGEGEAGRGTHRGSRASWSRAHVEQLEKPAEEDHPRDGHPEGKVSRSPPGERRGEAGGEGGELRERVHARHAQRPRGNYPMKERLLSI